MRSTSSTRAPSLADASDLHGGRFEENMVLCVERVIGEISGQECIKLKTQVAVRPEGAERLDRVPWEEF